MDNQPIDYPTVFRYVGQLFIESRHALENVIQQARQRESELAARLSQAEAERDDALRLMGQKG